MEKPNFKVMTRRELRSYIIAHREDDDAIHELFINRRNPNATQYPSNLTDEEMKEILKRKINGEL